MYSNILVPVVFDEGHDTQASYLAAKALAGEGAKFTVIHVLEEIPAYAVSALPRDLAANARAEAEKALTKSAQALPGATTELISGHAGRAIVEYAASHDVDCIVVASHKPGLEDLLLGSTASRVVRHAKCAVHIIR